MLSRRVQAVKESLTLALTAKAKALRAAGRDVVAFTAGELDFAPPAVVGDAVAASLKRGETRYTAASGKPSLREAVADSIEQDLGLRYTADEVIVSCGAKHSIYNLLQVLCDEGDEVVIPAPYWLSYPAMALLAGAKPVEVPPGPGFKLTAAALDGAITERSKVLILNSPGNPTGAVYDEDELTALAEVIRRHKHLVVISDEIYRKLVFGGAHAPSILEVAPDLRPRTAIVNGVSKSFAMTGLRIGWVAGPPEIVGACGRLQSQSTSNPSTLSQAAAEAALREGEGFLEPVLEELERRRKVMVGALQAMPGIELEAPRGAFYCFPSVQGLLGREVRGRVLGTAVDVASLLLEEIEVVLVPGDPFGAPANVRLSFALGLDDIQRGLERLDDFLSLTKTRG